MHRVAAILTAALLLTALAAAAAEEPGQTGSEPPARQAAASPETGSVEWRSFSPEVLREAADSGRLILLYITAPWGYHDRIMSDLTFSDPRVGRVIAASYLPVEVSTDHRPDLFARYGLRAWPTLTVVLPDGKPFFHPSEGGRAATRAGGTFYTPESFAAYFGQLADYYAANREMVRTVSNDTALALLQRMNVEKGKISGQALHLVVGASLAAYGERPSAPTPGAYHPDFSMVDLAFYHWFRTADREVLDAALHHLTDIVRGGIYDRLGGGFFRYAHDAFFRVPAFEKLPPVNAKAIRAYLSAYQVTNNAVYLSFAERTLAYVTEHAFDGRNRSFLGGQAAWTRTGDNGEYYTWTEEEFRAPLTEEESRVASLAYDIRPSGEMIDTAPRRNVIYVSQGPKLLSRSLEIEEARAADLLESANRKLLAARNRRPAPGVDPATYGDWSGMMISAFLHAAATMKQVEYADRALGALEMLHARCRDPRLGLVAHTCFPERAERGPEAFFADQVRVGVAFADAYEFTGSETALTRARGLADLTISTYRDSLTGGFSDRKPDLAAPGLLSWPKRELEVEMLMVELLLRLHQLTGEGSYRLTAREVLEAWADEFGKMAEEAAPYALASQKYLNPPLEVLVVGDAEDRELPELRLQAVRLYHPWRVVRHLDLAGGTARLRDELGLKPLKGAQVALCSGDDCAGPFPAGAPLGSHLRDFFHPGSATSRRDGGDTGKP